MNFSRLPASVRARLAEIGAEEDDFRDELALRWGVLPVNWRESAEVFDVAMAALHFELARQGAAEDAAEAINNAKRE